MTSAASTVLLVEPGWTSTTFDANSVQPDQPMEVYAERRRIDRYSLIRRMSAAPIAMSGTAKVA
jgi:hypothetical protein